MPVASTRGNLSFTASGYRRRRPEAAAPGVTTRAATSSGRAGGRGPRRQMLLKAQDQALALRDLRPARPLPPPAAAAPLPERAGGRSAGRVSARRSWRRLEWPARAIAAARLGRVRSRPRSRPAGVGGRATAAAPMCVRPRSSSTAGSSSILTTSASRKHSARHRQPEHRQHAVAADRERCEHRHHHRGGRRDHPAGPRQTLADCRAGVAPGLPLLVHARDRGTPRSPSTGRTRSRTRAPE